MASWIEEFLEPVLRHREAGHALRFNAKKDGRAKVYCFECKTNLMDGEREMVHAVYESVLQWPIESRVQVTVPLPG